MITDDTYLHYVKTCSNYIKKKIELIYLLQKRKQTPLEECRKLKERLQNYYKSIIRTLEDQYYNGVVSEAMKRELREKAANMKVKTEKSIASIKKEHALQRRSSLSGANIKWPASLAQTAPTLNCSFNTLQRRASIDTQMQATLRVDYAKRAVTISHIPVDDVRRLIAQQLYATEFDFEFLRPFDMEACHMFLDHLASEETTSKCADADKT